MTVRILLLALCLLLCSELPASPKGAVASKDAPWDPRHIGVLPVEVRHYITGICKGPPSAQHDFATYSPNEHRWRINLEYLHCNGLGEYRRGRDWTWTSLMSARGFGSSANSIESAASEPQETSCLDPNYADT